MERIRSHVIYSIIDQFLLSSTNFAIGLVFIHYSSKHNYGLYGIAYSTILLAVGFANALITTQMTVLAHDKPQSEFDRYCFSMLMAQYLIFLPILIVAGFLICCFIGMNWLNKDYLGFGLMVCFSILGMLLWEFMRRYFFLKLRPKKVLYMDILLLSMMFIFIFLSITSKRKNLHEIIIIAYGVCSIISGLIGARSFKSNRIFSIHHAVSSLKEAWVNGRWALGGVMVTWVQNQGYVVLLSILLTPSSVGEVNAARLFLAPIGVLNTSLTRVVMPRLALLRSKSEHQGVILLARKILILTLAVLTIYSIFVFASRRFLLEYVVTREYAHIGGLIIAWSAVYFWQAFRSNLSLLLQVYKEFRSITLSNLMTAIIVITLGIILIELLGPVGSVSSLAIGELCLFLLLWKVFSSIIYKDAVHNVV